MYCRTAAPNVCLPPCISANLLLRALCALRAVEKPATQSSRSHRQFGECCHSLSVRGDPVATPPPSKHGWPPMPYMPSLPALKRVRQLLAPECLPPAVISANLLLRALCALRGELERLPPAVISANLSSIPESETSRTLAAGCSDNSRGCEPKLEYFGRLSQSQFANADRAGTYR